MSRQLIVGGVVVSMALLGAEAVSEAAAIRTAAISGQQVQGGAFSIFGAPVINDAGETAFIAFVGGDRSVVTDGGGLGMRVVARKGQQADGMPAGVGYGTPNWPVINSDGQVAFRTGLQGSGITNANNAAVYSEGGGAGAAAIARRGDQAAGLATGVLYDTHSDPVMNDSGHAAFHSNLMGSGVDSSNRTAIFSEGGGAGLTSIARAGDPAAGMPSGVDYSSFGRPVINNAGQTAFQTYFTNGDSAIYSEGAGAGLAPVARSGEQAAGLNAGAVYDSFSWPVLNDSGESAFQGYLTGTGVSGSNNAAIFSEGGGVLHAVAREGDQAPGLASGVNFSLFGSPLINEAGHTSFFSNVTGPGVTSGNREAIYTEDDSGLSLVARTGEQAPGMDVGITFKAFSSVPSLNDVGQTAFFALLDDGSATLDSFFATDLFGNVHLLAAAGQMIDVNNDPLIDDFRTISAIEDVHDFNNAGELAFQANFTDGSSGVFVATVPVPSPGVVGLPIAAGLLAMRRKRN